MKAFFSTPERNRELIREARSWIGTPFWPHGRRKWQGVDCVTLALGIYQAVGLIENVKLPTYTVGAGSHLTASAVAEFLRDTGLVELVETPQTGDLLGFKLGRVVHHVGILTDGRQFVHALHPAGAIESSLADPTFSATLTHIWRPIDV